MLPLPPAPGTTSGSQNGHPDLWSHPHAPFHYMILLHARARAIRTDVGPLIEDMAGYVAAFAPDTWFDKEWERLHIEAKRRGVSVTGLSKGMTMAELRHLQFHLIMKGARRARLMEGPAVGFTPSRLEEKKDRLRRRKA